MTTHTATKTAPVAAPAPMPGRRSLLQRKCACGGAPGLTGECPECRGQRLRRRRAAGARPSPAVRDLQGSPGRNAPGCVGRPRQGHDSGRVQTGVRPVIQPKFAVGHPGDRYEREADLVADRILRMPDPGAMGPAGLPRRPGELGVRRGCPSCEARTRRRSKKDEERESVRAREVRDHAPPAVHPDAEASIHSLRGGGQPLPSTARAFFEPKFGHDFGQVRVHTDARAAETARAINARAFTAGKAIFFGAGQYAPESGAGQRLLAHELAHVVQQVPHVARQAADECASGHAEGQGQLAGEIYVMWGTFRGGETIRSWTERVVDGWISWRFGRSLAPAARARILRDLLSPGIKEYDVTPVVGCQYYVRAPTSVISAIVRMVGRMPAAEAAEAREAEAGLPPTEEGQAAAETKAEQPPPQQEAEGTAGQDVQPGAQGDRAEAEPDGTAVTPTGSEFEGGKGRKANAAALPAELTGPDRQTVRGTGTYRMQLDYSIAGMDTLSQVVEAMNWVSYHWERYDITELVRQGLRDQASAELRHRATSDEAEVGRMEASGRRAETAVEDLGADVEHAVEDLADPIEAAHGGDPADVVTRAMANYASLELLPASAIVSAGGVALGALADLVGGTFQEREIPWPNREGYFLIRCIAVPSPQGRNGETQRAASVETKVVEVQRTERIARESLDEPEAQIAELELQLAMEQDPARRRELETRIADARTQATGDPLEVLRRAIERKTAERDAATGRRREILQRELDALSLRLRLAEAQRGEMTGPIYRPRAVLASQVTGETYPLLLQLGALPTEGGRYRYRIADVTSPDGKSWTGRGATPDEAVWNAAKEMASHNDYGRGRLAIRLPANAPFEPREKVLESAPRDIALARQRLSDLVTVLVVLGLFVPGVGEVAAVLGAAMAADHLIERWRNHTLRFDAATVSDLIGILGAAGQGAAVIGRMRVVRAAGRFVLATEAADEAALRVAASALRAAQTAERVIEVGNQIVNYGGMVWGNLVVIDAILEINQRELDGTLSHAQARRQRAELLASAIRDNAIQIGQALQAEGEPARRPGEAESPARPPETAAPRAGETAPPVGRPGEGPAAETPGRKPPPGETIDEPELRRGEEEQRRQAGTAGQAEQAPGAAPDRIVARATTPDGLHEIFVLRDGRIFRCSRTCTEVQAHYEGYLSEQGGEGVEPQRRDRAAELDRRLRELLEAEQQIKERERSGEAVSPEEHKSVADDVAQLDMQLRQFAAEGLSAELQVRPERMANLLEVFTPAALRELHAALKPALFEHLAARDPAFIREFSRVWDITSGDPVAREEIAHSLDLTQRGVNPADVTKAFHELAEFLDRYPGRVSGDMVSRFRRAVQQRGDPKQALAEIALARDILEGRTPLGSDVKVEGIAESGVPEQKNPEYRATDPSGKARIVEIKRVGQEGGDLSKNGLKSNLGAAIGQVVGQSRRTGETEGFIRVDAQHTTKTALTSEDIKGMAAGELRFPRTSVEGAKLPEGTTVRGIDYVRWIEVLYKDAAKMPRRLLLEVQGGQLVVVSGGDPQ